MSKTAAEPSHFVGWQQFLTSRTSILGAFDNAKAMNVDKSVKTEHGNVAESKLREWLESFLPRRYGITSGYIIPEIIDQGFSMRHFDVIVYDALNAPTLWVEDNVDRSAQGRRRAIPAEHVLSVIECKSRLNKKSFRDSLSKLSELDSMVMDRKIARVQRGRYLPSRFVSYVVFVEYDYQAEPRIDGLVAMKQHAPRSNFGGGLILRNASNAEQSGMFALHVGPGEDVACGVRAHPMYDPFLHSPADIEGVFVHWGRDT